MTCAEKLKVDHPEWDDNELTLRIYQDCPYDFGYHTSVNCDAYDHKCTGCWDSEVEEPKEESKLIYAHTSTDTISAESDTYTANPVIKDSGNRREFESGAVRDMQEGKGRCDLMPLEVVSKIVSDHMYNPDPIVNSIALFQKTLDTKNLYNALDSFAGRAFTEPNVGSSCCTMCLEVAKHFEEGAKKYGESNWKRGIPLWCYLDSAMRHYIKWRRGDKDERHDRAFVWNLMCCIWEADHHNINAEAVNA